MNFMTFMYIHTLGILRVSERLSNHVKLLRVIPACHLDEGVVLPEPGVRIFLANKKGQKTSRHIQLDFSNSIFQKSSTDQ